MPITPHCVEVNCIKDWRRDSCSMRRLRKRQMGGGGKMEKLGMK